MTQQLSPVLMLYAGEPAFHCPGCKMVHRINVNAPSPYNGAQWTWDGNVDKPTFHPSLLIPNRCHSFIQAGKIQFLPDCDHELAGRTVDLPVLTDDDLW
jgi:hypothetical protein